jgi:hypothetical protein
VHWLCVFASILPNSGSRLRLDRCTSRETFAEAEQSTTYAVMAKHRLNRVRSEIYRQPGVVLP